MKASGILIEFVGIPGSGKSTIADKTASALKKRGIVVKGPTSPGPRALSRWLRVGKKVCFSLCVFTRFPVTTCAVLWAVLRSRQTSLKDYVRTTLHFFFVCETVAELSKRPGIHILDQGVGQAIWTIAYSANATLHFDPAVTLVARCAAAAQKIIIVDVDVSPVVAFSRLQRRSTGRSRLQTHVEAGVSPALLRAATSAASAAKRFAALLSNTTALPLALETVKNENLAYDLESGVLRVVEAATVETRHVPKASRDTDRCFDPGEVAIR